MKKILFITLFALTVSFSYAQANDQAENAQRPTLKEKVVTWAENGLYVAGITFVFGMFAKQGFTLVIKKVAGRGAAITKEVGELMLSKSNFMRLLDNSIQKDGKLRENSVKELIAAGKEVIAEAKDVIVVIKPKKK